MILPKFRQGQRLGASHLNTIVDALSASMHVRGGQVGRVNVSAGGVLYWTTKLTELWAMIDDPTGDSGQYAGADGTYSWMEVHRANDDTWQQNYVSGLHGYYNAANAAYEINAQAGVRRGTIVRMFESVQPGKWLFEDSLHEPILFKLIARTEITNPGIGDSSLTAVYDGDEWTETPGNIPTEKTGGLTARAASGTGIIERQFGNMAMEGDTSTDEKFVYAWRIPGTIDVPGEGEVSWLYVCDQGHTNTDGPYTTIGPT